MIQDTKNIKVFISSTFQDLNNERDYLVRKVFPSLRDKLEINVSEIDLRWGITEDESHNGRVIDLCLQYLYDSRPYFIGILGERYGSILNKNNIILSDFIKDIYPDVRGDINKGLSITEIEILNGVFRASNDRKPKAIFFIKETSSPAYGESYDDFVKLQELKSYVKSQKDIPYYIYDDDLKIFDKVEEFILNDLIQYKKDSSRRNPEDEYVQSMYRQLSEYLKHTPSNLSVLDELMPFIERANPIVVLEGLEGNGKSSLLAQLGNTYKGSNRLFIHLYGTDIKQPISNFLFLGIFLKMSKNILKRHQQEQFAKSGIRGWLNRNFSVDLDNEEALIKELGRHKWCIVLDDVNSYRYQSISPLLLLISNICNVFSYLKQNHGISVDYRILVSNNISSRYSIQHNKYEKYKMPLGLTVPARKFVSNYLSSFSKRLTSVQLERLVACQLMKHPRSMNLACSYMRKFISHEQLTDYIDRLQSFENTYQLYGLFADKLRKDVSEDSARRVITLISMFSCGITKYDLQNLSNLGSIEFYKVWSILDGLLKTDYYGSTYWHNDQIRNYFASEFKTDDLVYVRSLAQECRKYFFPKINNCYAPEDLQSDILKNWWMYKTMLITSLPNRVEIHKQVLQGKLDDLQVLSLLQQQGAFTLGHIRHHLYMTYVTTLSTNEYHKAMNQAKKDNESQSFSTLIKTGKWLDYVKPDFWERISRYHEPHIYDIHCYLESLRIIGDYKSLETAMLYPKVLNYAWNSMVYIDCWHTLLNETQANLCKKELIGNNNMLMVAYMLGNQDAINYYSQKKIIIG